MSARRLLVGTAGALAVASVATAQTANLAEAMRAILLPNSNVIFAAQHDDFAAVTSDPDPSLATDPFKGVYGGWQAVDNAGIALVEATRLLTVPGRLCSNGKPVPVREAEFLRMIGDLRAAGTAASDAARLQNHEGILNAAEKVSAACSRCHLRYREKGGEENRCSALSLPGAARAPAARTSPRPAQRSAVRR